MNSVLFFNSIMLGIGLAMDAFSVSLANGLNDTNMSKPRMIGIAGIFAGFQTAMPLIGWVFVSYLTQYFEKVQKAIPWIALILLLFIGGKMLLDGIKECKEQKSCDNKEENSHKEISTAARIGIGGLVVQGIVTSIDALSVGFTIAHYGIFEALLSSVIIGLVTYIICFIGLALGKKVGTKLAGKAGILGGLILIFIGLEIFFS